VLDGDESFRTGLAGNLRDDGHRVVECAIPGQIDLDDAAIGALVAVLQLGRNSCLPFIREFRRVHPGVPTVVLTTGWSPRIEEARKLGTVLTKSTDYDTVHRLVHRARARRD
jgi:ActR/RegA family two-component response regulator